MKQLRLIREKQVRQEKEQFFLEYYLVKEQKAYGIMIIKKAQNQLCEMEETGTLFYEAEQVVSLIKKLADGTITPFVLNEVIDDIWAAV